MPSSACDRRSSDLKQKTAYEISECDWSSDVCSSDRSEEHTSETPVTFRNLVCRLLLEKKKIRKTRQLIMNHERLKITIKYNLVIYYYDSSKLLARLRASTVIKVVVLFNETATTEIYTLSYSLSLHDALPIYYQFDLENTLTTLSSCEIISTK